MPQWGTDMWKRALAIAAALLLDGAVRAAGPPVEIMVFGTEHLNLVDQTKNPIAIDKVRDALAKFEPDLIVLEWLHPSVDRAAAFNYAPLGDGPTLRRLWGMTDATADAARIAALKAEIAATPDAAAARIELGKLLYLSGDQLNAAYQWWRADRAGADIGDLKRLSRNNMAGHEIGVWGFEIAAARGHEYVSPFDYQGTDIGSEVWGQMLEALRERGLRHDGLAPGAPGYEAAATAFDTAREAFEAGTSDAWLDRYGRLPEIAEYARAWRGFSLFAERRPPPDPAGLAMVRWLQSDDHLAVERRVNDELVRQISIDGLGAKRGEGNIERNRRMAHFARQDIERLHARRVLVIVGATHRYFLKPIFEEMGLKWVPASRYVP